MNICRFFKNNLEYQTILKILRSSSNERFVCKFRCKILYFLEKSLKPTVRCYSRKLVVHASSDKNCKKNECINIEDISIH